MRLVYFCLAVFISSSITTTYKEFDYKEKLKQEYNPQYEKLVISEIGKELTYFIRTESKISLGLMLTYCDSLNIRVIDSELKNAILELKLELLKVKRMLGKERFTGRRNRLLYENYLNITSIRKKASHNIRYKKFIDKQFYYAA
jgi:hypothetical protein